MDLEAEFLVAASAQAASGDILEMCAVLNRLPSDGVSDRELIDAIDSTMEVLFQTKRLTCPGHRWLTYPISSIRGHLTKLFDDGYIRRDAEGRWAWRDVTSYFVIWNLQ
jgi:hypothetical protein